MEGERVACGAAHPDNVAPSLHGGFVLIRHGDTPEVIELPVPAGLCVAIVRPHLEVRTKDAREALPREIRLADAVVQWSHLASLIAALHRSDLELLGRSLRDVVAEPRRAAFVPGFRAVQRAALDAGALGCSLSGSGPSVFALCRTRDEATRAAAIMQTAFTEVGHLPSDAIISAVGARGASVEGENSEPGLT
jgi:homoserine kinase